METSRRRGFVIPRPAVRATALAVTLVLVVGACSSGGGGGGANKTTAGGGTVDPTGVLRYGIDMSVNLTNTFDPAKSQSTCEVIVLKWIYDTLLNVDQNGNLQPGLAESWKQDGNTLTLTLRKNLLFQDGAPLDANAVKTSFEHLKTGPQTGDAFKRVTKIEAVDPVTVRVTFGTPNASFPYSLTGREGMIISPAAIPNAATKPVGAGPFKLDHFTPNAVIALRPYDGYWNRGAYKLGGIDFTQVSVGPPSVSALEAGSLDVARPLADSLEELKKHNNIKVVSTPSLQYLQFEFRIAPPFDKLEVRQAVEYALNREELNTVLEGGLGEVATQEFPKTSPFYDPSLAGLYSYNPTKAKQLLAQAGFPNGLTIDLVIPTGANGAIAQSEREGEIIQSQLKAVGINSNITRSSQIGTEFYISRKGNAFAASELAVQFAPDRLNDNFAKFQFVAIYDNNERQDITDIVTKAYASADPNEVVSLVKQGEKIVMENALDAPIAFEPQLAAYDTGKVGGSPIAPADACRPVGLEGVFIKK